MVREERLVTVDSPLQESRQVIGTLLLALTVSYDAAGMNIKRAVLW